MIVHKRGLLDEKEEKNIAVELGLEVGDHLKFDTGDSEEKTIMKKVI